MTGFRWLTASLRRLATDRSGNVAVIFALASLPILFAVGAAVDYSGASDLQVKLQRATDAALLQLCQMSQASTQGQRQATAQTTITSYLGSNPFTIDTLAVTSSPYRVSLATHAPFTTSFVTLMGAQFKTLNVGSNSQCEAEQQTFEIALVLDNTGSMASSSGSQSKIDALKAAATNFVNYVYNTPQLSQTKISIVPFAAAVAVDPVTYRNASWIDQAGKSSYHWSFLQAGAGAVAQGGGVASRLAAFGMFKNAVPAWDWTGCLESLPYPYNVQDGAPATGKYDTYYVPMLAPDESGDGGQYSHNDASGHTVVSANSYLDDANSSGSCATTTDETGQTALGNRTSRYCKYVPMQNANTVGGRGPNFSCTVRPLTRLTSNKTLLLNEISQLKASGNTNVHEGFMWGWRTLSPASVFADGAPYGKAYNNKIVIVMTDGTNTWSSNSSNVLQSTYSAYGFFKNPDGSTAMSPTPRLPTGTAVPSTDAQARAAIDALTLTACKNAAASPTNVQIYTIGFSVPSDPIDQQGLKLLQNCAGSDDRSFVANDANALVSVFQKIAASIGSLRLTK